MRSLPQRFRPKVIVIGECKDTDLIRIDELIGSIQTYEMSLSNSQKPRDSTLKAYENEEEKYSNVI